MTKSSDATEDDQSEAAQTANTGRMSRNRWVSREQFIQLLVAHHRLVRCDDLESGLRGLMDPTTGDCFFIGEKDLLKPQSA